MLDVNGWTLQVRRPDGPAPHRLIVMLHGLTGDENAMWVFAARLPKDVCLLAPRGLYRSSLGGYSWQNGPEADSAAELDDFRESIEALQHLLAPENFPDLQLDQIGLVGFSQGAALSYCLALSDPGRLKTLAGLSGFLPRGAERLATDRAMGGKTVFMAHGTQDDMAPFARAQHARQVFEEAGAQVIFCTDDVGHKLSSGCFRGLQEYYSRYF